MVTFYIKNKSDKNLRARDLRKGMKVPFGDKIITVANAYFLDGSGGEQPALICEGGKTAIALMVEFDDHEPLVCHPSAIVR